MSVLTKATDLAVGKLTSEIAHKEQFLLYKSLISTNLTLKNYFSSQSKIDSVQRKGANKFEWENLRINEPNAYKHELAHKQIYDKYGIKSQLYKKNIAYFVMDTNFPEVADNKDYDKNKVIEILKEMHIDPYKKIGPRGNNIEYLTDIVFYETLTNRIKGASKKELKAILKEYY